MSTLSCLELLLPCIAATSSLASSPFIETYRQSITGIPDSLLPAYTMPLNTPPPPSLTPATAPPPSLHTSGRPMRPSQATPHPLNPP